MVRAAMRIVLLLTFGFPVLAAQLVALAHPRTEPVLCSREARQVAATGEEDERPRALAVARVVASAPVVVLPVLEAPVAPRVTAPEGASARALTFVKHHRRQAT